jgi:hypothetical protein
MRIGSAASVDVHIAQAAQHAIRIKRCNFMDSPGMLAQVSRQGMQDKSGLTPRA